MLTWEHIPHERGFSIERAKVFGGWLVHTCDEALTPQYGGYNTPTQEAGYQWRTSITFVPDPKHEWIID